MNCRCGSAATVVEWTRIPQPLCSICFCSNHTRNCYGCNKVTGEFAGKLRFESNGMANIIIYCNAQCRDRIVAGFNNMMRIEKEKYCSYCKKLCDNVKT